MPTHPWKGGGWLPWSTWEEACANTQQAALLGALATAQPGHGLIHPLTAPCRLPSTRSLVSLREHRVCTAPAPPDRTACASRLPNTAARALLLSPAPSRDTHSFSTAERFPSITLTKSWYEMVSLTPPVTSEIIFFSSRWVFGAPNFSIILLTDIKSTRARQSLQSRGDPTDQP